MRDEQALVPRPGTPREPLTLVSQLDGSVVTVGTQPGIDGGARVIVMRLQSSLLDVLNAVYLLPVEAQRLADSLSSAATMAGTGTGTAAPADRFPARVPDEGPYPYDLVDAEPASLEADAVDGDGNGDGVVPDGNSAMDGMAAMHTVTASEGASAGELRDALGTLPSSAELVDFGADADVILVFATTSRSRP
ncbi:hypothetical protein [Pseudofrankia asymbiotica]|uniref:Uncharacterized protein n=1 Tax=Pseudofrankia asymbiotica TaxID=1834516 RepID=A0A1V2IAK0_9ACTN|nr:hypothetical protein [Pseudofrankia asymbiotica]ONH30223.1 hypothetical protein BL253_15000 [Pseudofrankia asymbiotica]